MYLDEKQLYIDNDLLYVQCPVCATTMKNHINGVAYNSLQCKSCKEKYEIIVNRRKHVRKNLMVQGRCFSARQGSFDAIIVNASKGGLKFEAESSKYKFSVEDTLRIKFPLKGEEIEVVVQISNICGQKSYGCIFLEEYSPAGMLEKIETIL